MKKSLLFAFAMLLCVTSGFAQSVGDYVYTPTGKFKVVADKVENLINADLTGWAAVSATDGAAVADQFTWDGEQGAVKSLKSAPAEGISYPVTSLVAGTDYVLSITIAQPEPGQTCHRSLQTWACDHIKSDANINLFTFTGVDEEGNSVEYAKPTEIMPGEAKTYSFAIQSEEARSYTLQLLGFAEDLLIKEIKIQEVVPVGDERTIAPYVEQAVKLLSLREWAASDYLEAVTENLEAAKDALLNADTQVDEMEGIYEGLREALNDFFANQMDDQLPGAVDKIPVATTKVQKVNNIGVWTGFSGGAGRIHSSAGGYYDVGHFAGNTKWGFGNGCLGLTTRIELQPGSYIFSMKQRAVSRLKSTSTCWDENTGLSCAYGVMYIRPVGDDAAEADIIQTDAEYEKSIANVYAQYNLPADKLEMYTVAVNITEAGVYEFAVKTYAQEHYKDMANGGTFEPFEAQIYAKTDAKYNKAQLDYEADVRGQIEAARENLTKAAEYLADAQKPWGREELKLAVAEYEPITAKYEAMTQDEIIATFDKDVYNKDKGLEAVNEDESTEEETAYWRLLASEVYRAAAKGIIAANNAFTAKNDTLASLNAAIAAAEDALTFRIYGKATGKAALLTTIADAKDLDAQMRATDYSEENAAAIVAAIAALSDATVEMKNSIPASAITTLVDIDFESEAVAVDGANIVEENGEATITGNVGTMHITSFSKNGTNISCQLGIADNGEIILPGVLRLGNAEGTVEFTAPEDNYGTDVVRVTMDWWFGNLSGRNAGFYLKNANDENIGGLYCNRYNGTTEYDATGIFGLGGVIGRGSSTQSNAVICEDGNLTHLEYVLDYGNKVAYCVSTLPTKVITTPMAEFDGSALCKFVIKSNYNNADRRCWFDNLKIERISTDAATGITEVAAPSVNAGKIYTISGVEVKNATKGIYIKNGKKFIVK